MKIINKDAGMVMLCFYSLFESGNIFYGLPRWQRNFQQRNIKKNFISSAGSAFSKKGSG
jgi:hypothetical protein